MSGARVVLVGAGGLGCAAALVLARAERAIEVVVIDDDLVDTSNLHRQVLHRSDAIGQPKATSLARATAERANNGNVTALALCQRVELCNARALVRGASVVIDGSDNFATRFLINDACAIERVPLVHAAAIRWQGQVLSIAAGAPCYRCLFEQPPSTNEGASCVEAGVAGPLVGVIGALAAEAALLLLDRADAGESESPLGRLLTYDGLAGAARTIQFRRNPRCSACGDARRPELLPECEYQVPAC